MSVNQASMIFGFASWVIYVLICDNNSYTLYWQPCQAKWWVRCAFPHHDNQLQWRVNDFWSSKSCNYKVISYWLNIMDVLAAFKGENESDMVSAPFWKWFSTKRQQFLALHIGLFKCWLMTVICIHCIHSLFGKNSACYVRDPIMKMSVNCASIIFSLLSQVITQWSGSD